jgi:tRNA(Ile)-lysidine synthetase-like protein
MKANAGLPSDPLLAEVLSFAPLWDAVAELSHPDGIHFYLLFSGGPDSLALALTLERFTALASKAQGKAIKELLALNLPPAASKAARHFFSRKRTVKLTLLHLNHRLRSGADEEQAWVQDFARKRKLACVCRAVDAAKYAATHKMSVEEAGRVLRYQLLQEHLQRERSSLGFTAHTLNDNAESVLYALAQRTGISGLMGIAPSLHGRILRPLLGVRKEEVLRDLKRRRQDFLLDETNLVPDRPRTFLRHEVIPRLQELNPKFLENVLATCENVQSYEGLFRWALKAVSEIAQAENARWHALLPLPLLPGCVWHAFAPASWGDDIGDSLTVIFHHLLRGFGAPLDWNESVRLSGCVRASEPARFTPGGKASLEYLPESGWLLIVRSAETAEMELGEGSIQVGAGVVKLERLEGSALNQELDALHAREPKFDFAPSPGLDAPTAAFNAVLAAGAGLPLKLRSVKRGDRMELPGGEGTAKLSDVFTNAKVPRALRGNWAVFADAAGEVLWLPGLVRSGAARVPAGAKTAWLLTYSPTGKV